MGEELVEESPKPSPKPYSEQFYDVFPMYLAIGMTASQFWEEDCTLVKYYREAHKLRQEMANRQAHLQGAYVYEAVGALVPVLHAFAKKNAKALPYLKEPYGTKSEQTEEQKAKHAENERLKAILFFKNMERSWKKKEADRLEHR